MKKIQVIAVVGPTSSGKSALGVYLAQKLGGEIISADSRQVYKGLDVGTGKITESEMRGIPHHLLNVVSPKKQFSADDFVRFAAKKIAEIRRRHKVPVVVGGTGFYVDALLGRLTLPDVAPDPKLRARLEKKSPQELLVMLKRLDPRRAKTIEPKHKRRLIRAIEIAKALGASPPAGGPLPSSENKYEVLWLGLNPPPQKLKKNIRIRLFVRIREGMIAEAKKLHQAGLSYKRMEELGLEYRFLSHFLQKRLRRQEFESGLERAIQKYAKRQMRWFKRNKDIRWIKNKTEALRLSKKFLSG